MSEEHETDIREYNEGFPVEIRLAERSVGGEERWAIVAKNEGGFCETAVDLENVANWIKANRPDLLMPGKPE